MFGYIKVNEKELKVKDYERYQSYYCGLCKTLKKQYGKTGQITLTYDMTFLIILLTALYEPNTHEGSKRCMIHPFTVHPVRMNEISKYGADMNILLTYHKLLDDWRDEKSLKGLAGSRVFLKKYKKIEKKYKRQSQAIRISLGQLLKCEKRNETNLDVVSRCFGTLVEEIFVYKKDEWELGMRKIGFYLGKFIYLLDAYDDLEQDRKKGRYNPLSKMSEEPDYEEKLKEILTLMMAECAKEFEKLPIIFEAELLRNIIYSGVWVRYQEIRNERGKADDI